ncbi:Protein of unknown function, partial [Gryllus bimaculatus]
MVLLRVNARRRGAAGAWPGARAHARHRFRHALCGGLRRPRGARRAVLANEPELLPGLDRQLAQLLRRHMEEKLGVTCLLGYQMESVSGAGERGGRVAVSAVRRDGSARSEADYDTVFRSDASCPRESDGHGASWFEHPLPPHECVLVEQEDEAAAAAAAAAMAGAAA